MPRIIKRTMDGKNYTFAPGKNGSLTATPQFEKPASTMVPSFTKPARVIGPARAIGPDVRKKRLGIQRALVGAARG